MTQQGNGTVISKSQGALKAMLPTVEYDISIGTTENELYMSYLLVVTNHWPISHLIETHLKPTDDTLCVDTVDDTG